MLENLKLLLGFTADDVNEERDMRLRLILTAASARLKLLLGGTEPPAEMEHIVLDVAVIRYNRIGSEGMSNHAVEGESQTFVEDDFAQYKDEIQAFLDTQKTSTRGKVRFI